MLRLYILNASSWHLTSLILLFFLLLKDDVKSLSNASLGEIVDVEAVLGLDHEDDEVSAECWEDVLGISTGALVNTDSSTAVST